MIRRLIARFAEASSGWLSEFITERHEIEHLARSDDTTYARMRADLNQRAASNLEDTARRLHQTGEPQLLDHYMLTPVYLINAEHLAVLQAALKED